MSFMRCAHCDDLVNTDNEPEAFVEVIDFGDDGATRTVCLCTACRNELELELGDENS